MLNDTIHVLSELVKKLSVGTNLSLLHVLWTLLSGALLTSSGALIPALAGTGLSAQATRRAWRAVRYGQWQVADLLREWQVYVRGVEGWTVQRYEGYRALAVDVTAFWRPTLKECPSQHYHPAAGRALPAVIIGLAGEVGRLNGQRLALPRLFERVHPADGREARLWQMLLKRVAHLQQADEIVVVDAGVKLSDLHEAGITRFVVRLATNFTAQRNELPAHTRGRKPIYGRLVRPLARRFNGNDLPATPPDECQSWLEHGRTFRVEIWRRLVLPKTSPDPANPTFDVYAIYDPAFAHPWLLATPVPLTPQSVRALYADRWPVEQLPLSATQMLGAHRQFVHHPQTVQRLPELALLVGSVLSTTDQPGHVTSNTYDLAGQLLHTTSGFGTADASTTSFTYDAAGRKLSQTDGLNRTTNWTYDHGGRLVSVSDPLSETTSYGYNAADWQTSVTDPLNRTTTYTFDSRHRLTTTAYPDTTATQQRYDNAGRLTGVTAADGLVTTYGYDVAGQLTSTTNAFGTTAAATTQYAYDAVGRKVSQTDPLNAVTQYTYDADNRLTQITDALNHTTAYVYDAAGQLTQETDPLSHSTGYSYDALGRQTQVTYPDNSTSS